MDCLLNLDFRGSMERMGKMVWVQRVNGQWYTAVIQDVHKSDS